MVADLLPASIPLPTMEAVMHRMLRPVTRQALACGAAVIVLLAGLLSTSARAQVDERSLEPGIERGMPDGRSGTGSGSGTANSNCAGAACD